MAFFFQLNGQYRGVNGLFNGSFDKGKYFNIDDWCQSVYHLIWPVLKCLKDMVDIALYKLVESPIRYTGVKKCLNKVLLTTDSQQLNWLQPDDAIWA